MNELVERDCQAARILYEDIVKISVMPPRRGNAAAVVKLVFSNGEKGFLNVPQNYPCGQTQVVYPNVSYDRERGMLIGIFFSQERILELVRQMVSDVTKGREPSVQLHRNDVRGYHRSKLQTAQAVRIYDQYLRLLQKDSEQAGKYVVHLTDVKNADADNRAAKKAIRYDHPEFFWFGKSTSTRYGSVIQTVTDICAPEEKETAYKALHNMLDRLTENTEGVSDLAKAHTIYTRLVLLRNYHAEEHCDWQFTGPALYGRGCCAGYSKIFMLAMNRVNIPCVVVYGDNHAWCHAMIDGKSRHFDVTWEWRKGTTVGSRYFALTPQQIRRDHRLDSVFDEWT